MKLAFLIICGVIFMFTNCVSSSKLKQNRQLLKEYAYCRCFQYASGDTAYFINDVSLSVYFDIANYDFNAYDKMDSLSRMTVAEFRPSEIFDYQNKKAVFLNCFNFYKSKRLDSLIRSLDKAVNRTW